MRKDVIGFSVDDASTVSAIKEVYEQSGYFIDPHAAVGYYAAKDYLANYANSRVVVLGTAHPAKFLDVMNDVLDKQVPIPEALAVLINKEKKATAITSSFEDFKSNLLNLVEQ